VICRYECTVMHAEGNSLSDSGHTVSYVQRVCSKDHSRQAFTTSVIGVVNAVSNLSVREPQGRSRLDRRSQTRHLPRPGQRLGNLHCLALDIQVDVCIAQPLHIFLRMNPKTASQTCTSEQA